MYVHCLITYCDILLPCHVTVALILYNILATDFPTPKSFTNLRANSARDHPSQRINGGEIDHLAQIDRKFKMMEGLVWSSSLFKIRFEENSMYDWPWVYRERQMVERKSLVRVLEAILPGCILDRLVEEADHWASSPNYWIPKVNASLVPLQQLEGPTHGQSAISTGLRLWTAAVGLRLRHLLRNYQIESSTNALYRTIFLIHQPCVVQQR